MTIVVGVACAEGLVLAADSRTSVLSDTRFRVATDYANKLFEVGLGMTTFTPQYAAATYGWAFLGGKTIAGHMEEFDATAPELPTVADAAIALRDYFAELVKAHIDQGINEAPPEGVDVLGFLVAGYDDQGVGHIHEVLLPSGQIAQCCSTTSVGAACRGEHEVFCRLMKGIDLVRAPIAENDPGTEAIQGLEYIVPFWNFALQDAVDYSAYLVRTTIDTQRFTDGVVGSPGSSPTCGGPIQIVALTARGGVEWLQRTSLRGDLKAGRAEGSQE